MNFLPLGKRVLLRRVEEASTTASGIIIPDNAKEKPLIGEVLAVSKEAAKKSAEQSGEELAPGARVLFAKYGGTEVKLDGEELVVLNLDDVLGILKG